MRIEQAWWEYDPARFREEVSLARQVHANTIRLWIEFTGGMRGMMGHIFICQLTGPLPHATDMDAVAAVTSEKTFPERRLWIDDVRFTK